MAVQADPRIGSDFARFRIEELVGRGGMSVVYRAHDPGLGRTVALKLLAPELTKDARYRERFMRESRMAASLDHPYAVPLFEAGEHEGQLFIAMRYVEGTDLKKLLRREGAQAPARVAAIVGQIAAVLDAAHALGLVHRDVKPGNVLVGEDGNAYLSDFGLTKTAAEANTLTGADDPASGGRPGGEVAGLTLAGDVIGTADYIAPEQLEDRPVDHRADVYSLGCVLFECLTGQVPFARDSELAVLWAHVSETPPRPTETVRDLPATIDAVVAKAMAKDPDARFSSAGELAAAALRALGLDGSRHARRWRAAVVTASIVMATAAAATGVLLSRDRASPTVARDSVVKIDAATGTIVKRYQIGDQVNGIAAGAGYVWITSRGDSSVWRLDPTTGATRRIEGLREPQAVLTAPSGSATVLVSHLQGVASIDPGPGVLSGPPAGDWWPPPPVLAAGPLGVWVAGGGGISRVEADGFAWQTVTNLITIAPRWNEEERGMSYGGIAVSDDGVWVTGGLVDHELFRVEPGARVVSRYALPGPSGAIALLGDSAWVAGVLDDVVWRFDRATGRVIDRVPVGRGPAALALAEGSLWVANSVDGTVTRLDASSGAVVATVDVGGVPGALAADGDAIWVASRAA